MSVRSSDRMRGAALAVSVTIAAVSAFAEAEHPLLPDRTPDIVILGEVHDNAEHHRIQAEIVAALRPRALVFEMLTPGQAAAGGRADEQSEDALRAALDWDRGGWPDFALYYPIFAAAPDAAIIGAALPAQDVRRAVTDGAAAVFGAEAAAYGLTRDLDPDQQARREALQRAAHCDALPDALLPGMVEAQRLRDAAFSRTTLHALETHGPPVAVITGWGHAHRNWGMPVYLEGRLGDRTLHVIGLLEVGSDPGQTFVFDRMIETAAQPRPDPCADLLAPGGD